MSRTPSFDPIFMRSICTATQKTFATQAGLPVDLGQPRMMQAGTPDDVAIIGNLDVDSPLFHGSLGLAFSKSVFLAVYEKMFGETYPDITPDLQDAAAEFMNIIYGTTKAELNQRPGYDLPPLLPKVLSGPALKARHSGQRPVIVMPFVSEVGEFHLEVALEKRAKVAA